MVPLLRESVEELLTRPEVIVNGFRCAGIVPWDPSTVNIKKIIPSSAFAKPSIEVQSIEKSEDLIEGTYSEPGTSAQMIARPSNEVKSVEKLLGTIERTSSKLGISA